MYIQYRSDARYKARGGKLTCTLRQIHVYTVLNGFIPGDKRVYTRRQTRLPYTLHLICTVIEDLNGKTPLVTIFLNILRKIIVKVIVLLWE